MDVTTSPTPAERDEILALAGAALAADGTDPLNEEARLLLGRPGATHWLLRDGGRLVGYAQWQDVNGAGQFVVHPEHRRRGHGTRLLEALASVPRPSRAWAFGNSEAAKTLAAVRGWVDVRGLHLMERALEPGSAPEPPPGVVLRPFTDADADAFLAVNAAAFAHHPEQGHFDRDDLANRQASDWWDPAGLILAEESATGDLLGFHWTKRHDADTGEVYVIGVHPGAAGRGLGRTLLEAGLHHLASGGARRVILYVDADNEAAVRLYERSGFTVAHTDTLYEAR